MKSVHQRSIATATVWLISFSLLAFSFAMLGSIPTAAAYTSSNCTHPSVPHGKLPKLSPFTIRVIGDTGKTVIVNQDNIYSFPACWSYGGYDHSKTPPNHGYGNYTGVPVLTLINLVGGIDSTGTVVATSFVDGFQDTYTYQEVVNGLGWGQEYTGSTSPPSPAATTVPMYLVLGYLWNSSAISPLVCTSLPAIPCTSNSGTESGGNGPERMTTLSSTPYYLLEYGHPWEEAVGTIQVFRACSSVPTSPGANLQGADLSYCNLAGYNLAGDNLAGANLRGANLAGADLQGATLERANLHGATLNGANTIGTNFQSADMHRADLQGDNLANDNLQRVNLQDSNLLSIDLQGANVQGSNLQRADLDGTPAQYTIVSSANFAGADLQGVQVNSYIQDSPPAITTGCNGCGVL